MGRDLPSESAVCDQLTGRVTPTSSGGRGHPRLGLREVEEPTLGGEDERHPWAQEYGGGGLVGGPRARVRGCGRARVALNE